MTVRLEFTVKATIPAVRSPILAIQWQRHRFGDSRQSHYYNNRPTGDGSTIVEDTNLLAVTKVTILVVWALAAFIEAIILTIRPPMGHYLVVRWAARPIRQHSSEPLFRLFGHRISTISGSIGRATDVISLLKI